MNNEENPFMINSKNLNRKSEEKKVISYLRNFNHLLPIKILIIMIYQ